MIGRKSFEKVLTFETWPYGDKRVVVLSSGPVDLSAAVGGVVEQMAGTPAEIISQLAASGAHHLYIDGGITDVPRRAGELETVGRLGGGAPSGNLP